MQFAIRKVYDVLVVDLDGRLDSRSVGDVGDQLVHLAQGAQRRVLLNLAEVTYISSAGLRVILRAAKLAQENHGEVKICSASDGVKEVLETAGFDSLIKLYSSEQAAVSAFRI